MQKQPVPFFSAGYNVSGKQARGWQSEIFKRMYWSGSKAKFWAVSWYGYDTQLSGVTRNYHLNVQHAFKTAPGLATFLNTTVGGDITVAAHSLGNMVVSSALSDQGANIKNYLMLDAAVAMEAYDGSTAPQEDPSSLGHYYMEHPEWNGYKKELWASEWHSLFPGDARNKLTWRDRFKNRPQGTAYYNFYSTGEEVLSRMSYSISSWDGFLEMAKDNGQNAWALQERLKGRLPLGWILGSNYGGWGFNNEYDIAPDPNYPNVLETMPPALANQIPLADLKSNPFFDKGTNDNDLFTDATLDPGIMTYDRRARLLAEAIPALTLPVGGDKVPNAFGPTDKFNFNMQDMQVNGWPAERTKKNWRHSDIKDVAYPYVQEFFKNLIAIGGLN